MASAAPPHLPLRHAVFGFHRLCQQQAAADEVVAAIEAGNGKAIAVDATSADESDILEMFAAADTFGTLGALVNNSGIVGRASPRVDEMSAERIQRIMAVNVTGRSYAPARR